MTAYTHMSAIWKPQSLLLLHISLHLTAHATGNDYLMLRYLWRATKGQCRKYLYIMITSCAMLGDREAYACSKDESFILQLDCITDTDGEIKVIEIQWSDTFLGLTSCGFGVLSGQVLIVPCQWLNMLIQSTGVNWTVNAMAIQHAVLQQYSSQPTVYDITTQTMRLSPTDVWIQVCKASAHCALFRSCYFEIRIWS